MTDFVYSPDVSRETETRLAVFETEFQKWAARINLVASSTIKDVRQRHIADSAQILNIAPHAKTVIDLGSGGGFPGLVLAIILADIPDSHVHLLESNGKKCAFLRHVTRVLSLPVTVHNQRIEDVISSIPTPDIVTARALAPLPLLMTLALPQLSQNVPAFFHKGRDHAQEITDARGEFNFNLLVHQSRINSDSVILEIRNVVPIAA